MSYCITFDSMLAQCSHQCPFPATPSSSLNRPCSTKGVFGGALSHFGTLWAPFRIVPGPLDTHLASFGFHLAPFLLPFASSQIYFRCILISLSFIFGLATCIVIARWRKRGIAARKREGEIHIYIYMYVYNPLICE